MQLIPDAQIGLYNAWLFTITYAIITFILMAILPKEKRKRITTFPKFNSKTEKIAVGITSFIFGRGLILYSLFIPIKLNTPSFYIGTIIYFIGMLSSVYAMWSFSQADLSTPVTGGIYKISRHPMQIMSILMWIGIGIATENWILIACAFLLSLLYYPSFKAQERYCQEKYGAEYSDYMKRTPRYLGLAKKVF